MFERLQKPFLTVETGEAYQPIRVSYEVLQLDQLKNILTQLNCLETKDQNAWNLYWRDECEGPHFESLENYKRNPQHPLRLGTLLIKNHMLYLNLPSFKRACLLVPLLHHLIPQTVAKVSKADFINKVFGISERLPHGFSELFNEEELENIVSQRIHDYETVQSRCEQAKTVEEAFQILSEYTHTESQKRLPFAERYTFHDANDPDPDIAYLGFYIFLRGRELVAIRRWFGETGYTLADAAEETMDQVFGSMHIDIIE